ncbi:MAG: single-strand DNA-binding protein [Pseudonocardiales bacterium]|nr:single-strand DNA-binding protein [Pseudonocardiales bacterium]MDT4941372.1 single-strand DNA-binding protein [Pseudonocardiales bacterium]
MNETTMTIVGNVVDDPRRRETKNGFAVTNFRVASTSRRFDREQERFVDNGTLYVTVTCWRAMAENVDKSIRKGQPVVVTGRYYQREYTVDEQVRTAYELEATAVGHDLGRGTSQFTRVYQSGPPVVVEKDDAGLPRDESDHWLDLGDRTNDDVPTEEALSAAS